MATVQYTGVGKVWPDGTRALRGLDLDIADGEFLVLVGASGCGKSTALRILAGLEKASEGELRIGGRVVGHLSPQARNIAMVFQSYALYPHMSVRDNLRFPLQMRKLSRSEVDKLVADTARMLDLEPLLERRPAQLSGGQRQRVAMGRALVRQPACFLMDEPLSNLDAKLRVQMRAEITTLQRRTGVTTVYVTHDQVEAMTMGQRVAVMQGGRLRQCAAPEELYHQPADIYVAGFIGSPAMNLFQAPTQADENGTAYLRIGEQRLRLPAHLKADGPGNWGLRPEHIVPPSQVPADQRLRLVPDEVEALGHERIAYLTMPLTALDAEASISQGQPVAMPGQARWSARLPGDFPIQRGETVELGIRNDRIFRFAADGSRLGTS
ncbi:MAG: ATP-binding cassette domain-containing protein [Planctomycetota bacterium]|nr:MAG: ATP-binding cassette domain-containing protein [Planctomycetota bacterium]